MITNYDLLLMSHDDDSVLYRIMLDRMSLEQSVHFYLNLQKAALEECKNIKPHGPLEYC